MKVFLWHRDPVSIVTKGCLITRDVHVLEALAARRTWKIATGSGSLSYQQ
jgi:DNA repair photolyase